MIAVKMHHHILLSLCSCRGHHLSVTYVIPVPVCVQIKFPVSSVVTRTTHQFRRVWEGFLMHSFLVGPQVTFRCRIINATSITNFDITIKAVLFLMCCPCVVFQFRFALEYLVTVVARDLHLSVDTPHV